MKRILYHALDECLALLGAHQATQEECLARYPKVADDLRPLLEVVLALSGLPRPTASPAAFAAGKRRMLEALAEKQRHQATPCALRSLFTRRAANLPGSPARARSGLAAWRHRLAVPLALAAVLVFALFAIGRMGFQSLPGDAVAQVATLYAVRGAVQVSRAGSDTWEPATTGEPIQAGDRIHTGPLSAVRLIFFDGSTTDLLAQTEVTIVQAGPLPSGDQAPGALTPGGFTPTNVPARTGVLTRITLRQTSGQTHSRVQSAPTLASIFEIETSGATSGFPDPSSLRVHVPASGGAEFAVAMEASGATHVSVVIGQAEVTAQQATVAVLAGQETTVQPQHPPSPPTSTLRTDPPFSPPSTATPVAPRPSTLRPTATAEPHNPHSTIANPQSVTPQPSGRTETPQLLEEARTHQPPGQTRTPPGQAKTRPGQAKPHKPPRKP